MMHARLLALAPVVALALVPACSNSDPAVTQGGANILVSPGSKNTSATCPVALPDNTWNIGGNGLSPVQDGADQNGAPVTVVCTVSGNDNDGYQVTADIEPLGKGSLTLKGTFPAVANASSGKVHAAFVLAGGLGSWTEDDCAVSYPTKGGIAAGRLWANVDCPSMFDKDHQTTCDGNAQVRFENCGI